MAVADDSRRVHGWRRPGSSPARAGNCSPVHSNRLPALAGPNALSARATRHKPG